MAKAPSLGSVDGVRMPVERNGWVLTEDDFLLYALLSDPVYMPELLWTDAPNRDYSGCYRVRDYQYQINRCEEANAIFASARSTGKTESQKVHGQCHCFTSSSEDMLITAPELIHLLPLTDKIEDAIRNSRLLRECLDVSYGRTGFGHRPFSCNLKDGTKIVGRIPKLKGPQPLTASVMTLDGSTTMGEIEVGQTVLGSDGTPVRIVDVTETWESEVFQIEFWGGDSVEADGEHLWPVQAAGESIGLRSTDEIRDHLSMDSALWCLTVLNPATSATRALPIRQVRDVGLKDVRCIKVDADDGLYLTNGYVLTHNTGVLGQHSPFVMMDEGQMYPPLGLSNLEEVVNYDAVDKDGKPRWRFWIFGVHDGNRTSGFSEKAKSETWKVIKVTRLMRSDWGAEAKERAKASYGGTSSPDYRRNIYGEPGDAASAYFITARLLACVDQKVERGEVKGSRYNTEEYVHQLFRYEELEEVGVNIADALDLPHGFDGKPYQSIYGGVDVGLNRSPTVISLFTETIVERKMRLKLFRRFTLERFRSKQIRQALYAIDLHYGGALMGIGVDSTGLGLPLLQELEDDEVCPPHLMQVIRGYFFSSKVPVAVAPENAYKDPATGVVKDQYGRMLEEQTMPDGSKRFVVYAPFITASTRYLAEWVDSGYLLLPFDQEITTDMLGETKERVERLQANAERAGGALRKPDIFHTLDSFRAMAMAFYASDIEEALAVPQQRPVLDQAM